MARHVPSVSVGVGKPDFQHPGGPRIVGAGCGRTKGRGGGVGESPKMWVSHFAEWIKLGRFNQNYGRAGGWVYSFSSVRVRGGAVAWQCLVGGLGGFLQILGKSGYQ
jgi:hypothetical protein